MPLAPAAKVHTAAPIVTPRVEPSIEAQADIAQLAAPPAAPAARSFPAAPSEDYEADVEDTNPFADALGGKPMWFWVVTVAGVWIFAMIFWLIFLPQFRGHDAELRKKQRLQQNQKTTQSADPTAGNR
jgi:hypothetical protein